MIRSHTHVGAGGGPLATTHTRAWRGVRDTLAAMVTLVQRGRSHPTVRDLALQATAGTDARDADRVAKHVHEWVRREIRYVPDPFDVELLQSADRVLNSRAADCDGMSVLAAAMLESLGIPSGFRATAWHTADRYDHVYVIYAPRRDETDTARWHALDPVVATPPPTDPHMNRAVSHIDVTTTMIQTIASEASPEPIGLGLGPRNLPEQPSQEAINEAAQQNNWNWQQFTQAILQAGPQWVAAFQGRQLTPPGSVNPPNNWHELFQNQQGNEPNQASLLGGGTMQYILLGGLALGGVALVMSMTRNAQPPAPSQ